MDINLYDLISSMANNFYVEVVLIKDGWWWEEDELCTLFKDWAENLWGNQQLKNFTVFGFEPTQHLNGIKIQVEITK